MPDAKPKFVLPLTIVGPADVNRLQLELESLEDYLRQEAQTGRAVKLPKMSRMLETMAEQNNADLTLQADRNRLEAFSKALEQHAPTIHISFASEPSAAFTQRVLTWLRGNISSYILLQIGLQPTIAAGCVVRTTNKVFDMSLRQYLDNSRHLLVEALHSLKAEEDDSDARRQAEIARIAQAAQPKPAAAPVTPAMAPAAAAPATAAAPTTPAPVAVSEHPQLEAATLAPEDPALAEAKV